jgi:hypothetical protein
MADEDQLLDYDEDQEETLEIGDKAADNGGAPDAKKVKVSFENLIIPLMHSFSGSLLVDPQQRLP